MKRILRKLFVSIFGILGMTGGPLFAEFEEPRQIYIVPNQGFELGNSSLAKARRGHSPTEYVVTVNPTHGHMTSNRFTYGELLAGNHFGYQNYGATTSNYDTFTIETRDDGPPPDPEAGILPYATQKIELIITEPNLPRVWGKHLRKDPERGECSVVVEYEDHLDIQNSETVTRKEFSPPSGTAFQPGTHWITYAVTNSYGTTVGKFELEVGESLPLVTQSNITVNNQPGQGGAFVNFSPTVVTCSGSTDIGLVCDPPSGSFFPIGTTQIVCTAPDVRVVFDVIVIDAEAPVMMVPENITVPAESGQSTNRVSFEVEARDNAGGLVNTSCNRASGSSFPIGTTVVNCSATDEAGNSSSRSFTVTVQAPADPGEALIVTTLADNGPGSLRAAIATAESTPEEDTILFDPALTASGDATILLTSFDTGLDGDPENVQSRGEVGPTAFILRTPIRIEGPRGDNGLTIQRDGSAGAFRLFHVLDDGSLTLSHLTLSGGLAKGGDGFGNGGGGAGLGGGIFNHGTLSLQNVLMVDNEARGGGGQTYTSVAGGGGGGLGSDGTAGSGGLPNAGPGLGFGSGGMGANMSSNKGGFGGGGGGGGANSAGGEGGFGGGGGGGYAVSGGPGFGGGNGFVFPFNTWYPGGGLGAGGAIFNEGGQVTLMSSTLSGNRALGGSASFPSAFGNGLGGGIFCLNGDAYITSSTIVSNTVEGTSPDGGGIFSLKDWNGGEGRKGERYHAGTLCYNSVIADSNGGTNDFATATIGSYGSSFNTPGGSANLIEQPGDLGSLGVISTSDPQLGPLSDNGGATLTHAPGASSPAIDTGDETILPIQVNDQRGEGFPRISRFSLDLGAFERQEMSYVIWQRLVFTPAQLVDQQISGPGADPDGDGKPNLQEYAFAMNPMVSDQIGDEWFMIDPTDMTVKFVVDTSRSDITYALESSSNLSEWQPITIPDHETLGIYQLMEFEMPDLDQFFARLAISQN